MMWIGEAVLCGVKRWYVMCYCFALCSDCLGRRSTAAAWCFFNVYLHLFHLFVPDRNIIIVNLLLLHTDSSHLIFFVFFPFFILSSRSLFI